MAEHDPNYLILFDRCYAMAQSICAVELGSEPADFDGLTTDELREFREYVRVGLRERFPTLGWLPLIAAIDAGLRDLGFPMNRL